MGLLTCQSCLHCWGELTSPAKTNVTSLCYNTKCFLYGTRLDLPVLLLGIPQYVVLSQETPG